MDYELQQLNKIDSKKNINPTVSIGMPVYNGGEFLNVAILSILSQTYSDFELIISDDLSTDNSSEICKNWELQDDRIIFHKQNKNLGPVENFNFVLNEARGKYFMWAAQDDTRAPNCLEFYLCNIKNYNAFFSSFCAFDINTNKIVRNFEPPQLSGEVGSSTDICNYFSKFTPSLMYGLFNRECLLKIGGETFDWWDGILVTQFIYRFGYKSISSEVLYNTGIYGQYRIKPMNRKKLNSWPFIYRTYYIGFFKGGFRGGGQYLRTLIWVLLITFKFNYYTKKDTKLY